MEGQSNEGSESQQKTTTTNSYPIVRNRNKQKSSIVSFFSRMFSKNDKSHYLESLSRILNKCVEKSLISSEEQKMINNIVNIDNVTVSDVMIPRTDIVAMPKDSSLDKIKKIIISKEHTRVPIYGENLDEIVGFIHSKDLVKFLSEKEMDFEIDSLLRKIIYVPHSMRIIDLLRKMRFSRVHIAIVLDEYGGTDGLITIEDIVEEIVGEIEDEHDMPDNNVYNTIKKVSNHVFRFGGRVEVEKVEELIEEKITKNNEGDFETIGGFILSEMKKVPQTGEVFNFNTKLSFKVLEADLRSIKLIEVTKDSA